MRVEVRPVGLALLALCCLSAQRGPVLTVAPVTLARGTAAKASIVLEGSDAAKPVAGLEWEIVLPGPGHGFEIQVPEVSGAAKSAGKSLGCSGQWRKAPQTYAYTCILAGGRNPIPDGIVALVGLKARADAKPGSYAISLEKIKAVTAGAAAVPLRAMPSRVKVEDGR